MQNKKKFLKKAATALLLLTVTVLIAKALFFTPKQTVTLLGTNGGNYTRATDINNLDEVIGNMGDVSDERSRHFIWSKKHGMRTIEKIDGADEMYIAYIDDESRVSGTSHKWINRDYSITKSTPFIWTRENGFREGLIDKKYKSGSITEEIYRTKLGGKKAWDAPLHFDGIRFEDISPNFFGEKKGRIRGINNKGQIIGKMFADDDNDEFAFVWSKETGIQRLNTRGGLCAEVTAINDAGQIVGYIGFAPAWWEEAWAVIAEKLNLSDSSEKEIEKLYRIEAALWTVPPPK